MKTDAITTPKIAITIQSAKNIIIVNKSRIRLLINFPAISPIDLPSCLRLKINAPKS